MDRIEVPLEILALRIMNEGRIAKVRQQRLLKTIIQRDAKSGLDSDFKF